jgi:ATP-binding cassette subfamily B protein
MDASQLYRQDAIKPKSVGATLARFWQYFSRYRLALVIVVAGMIFSAWAQVTTPTIIGYAVDCYLSPLTANSCTYTDRPSKVIDADPALTDQQKFDEKAGALLKIAGTLALLYVIGSGMAGVMSYAMAWAGQHVLRDLRKEVFTHVHKLSLGYYTEHEAGDIMSRFTNDSDTIQQVISFALVQVLSGGLVMFWIAYNMLTTNLIYGLIGMAVVPLMFIAAVYFSGQARLAFRRSRKEIGNVNANLEESIAGVREVQAFNREDENIANFRRTNAANRDANVAAASFTSAQTPVLEALGYVGLGLVILFGGISVLRNEPLLGVGEVISLGTIFVFLQYVQRFNQPVQQISVLWTNIQSAIAGGERIFGLLDVQPDLADKPDAKPMPEIQGHVAFVDVRAEYKKGEPVLKGVNIDAQPGQTVAIVGPTGAGKTTIINLIPRFWDVTDGKVLIDGIDVRDVQAATLRKQIGLVLQDSFLFSDTVMNNIRYGRPEATDEAVMTAAKLASADTFIERLPQGYQTMLGERGSGLSQGQRQLISIARAALADPRILILDEATSSVDTRTEKLIQAAFEKLLKGRTTFVIAHRLSTIRDADQVLMLRAGEIIERGTHNELLAKKGAYYELYQSQFRREEQTESGSAPAPILRTAPQGAGD